MNAKAQTAARVGIGLRAPHIEALLADTHAVPWVEIHSENWMTESGPIADKLMDIRSCFDISLHGVGLSLGSADGLDYNHLRRLRALIGRTQPILVSEHLCWGRAGARHSNDLLPLPYTREAVTLLADRIDETQQFLGRRILVENLSSYCTFAESTMPEWVFVRDVVERADCGLLLDLNNIHVNAHNHGFRAEDYLSAVPWARVDEVHLAGFDFWDNTLIDTHGRPVQPPVWSLLHAWKHKLKPDSRVLIEWDTDLPSLSVLLGEMNRAREILDKNRCPEAAHA